MGGPGGYDGIFRFAGSGKGVGEGFGWAPASLPESPAGRSAHGALTKNIDKTAEKSRIKPAIARLRRDLKLAAAGAAPLPSSQIEYTGTINFAQLRRALECYEAD